MQCYPFEWIQYGFTVFFSILNFAFRNGLLVANCTTKNRLSCTILRFIRIRQHSNTHSERPASFSLGQLSKGIGFYFRMWVTQARIRQTSLSPAVDPLNSFFSPNLQGSLQDNSPTAAEGLLHRCSARAGRLPNGRCQYDSFVSLVRPSRSELCHLDPALWALRKVTLSTV